MYNKKQLKTATFNYIEKQVPNFKGFKDKEFEKWIDYSFNQVNKLLFTREEVQKFLFSFVDNKIVPKNILGLYTPIYTPIEVELAKCNKLFDEQRKYGANLGGMEYFIHFVLGWDWSNKKGCDLIDPNGKHVDVKLTNGLYSNAGIPGQFFDENGIPFIKHHRGNYKWYTHNGEEVWNSNMEKSCVYTGVINHIKFFKIDDEKKPDRYMYCYLDPEKHILSYVEKTPTQIEYDANHNVILNEKIDWKRRIEISRSKWEHGSVKYNIKQVSAIP